MTTTGATDLKEKPTWEHDGWPTTLFSHDALMKQGHDGGIMQYVWEMEGQFVKGRWTFHKGEAPSKDGGEGIPYPERPLMVDASSARAYSLVYAAVSETHKAKLVGFSEEHRGLFVGLVMEKLVWPFVSFGGR